jgi:hypothetical protein
MKPLQDASAADLLVEGALPIQPPRPSSDATTANPRQGGETVPGAGSASETGAPRRQTHARATTAGVGFAGSSHASSTSRLP